MGWTTPGGSGCGSLRPSGYPKQHLLSRIVLPIPTEAAKTERTKALWDTFAA